MQDPFTACAGVSLRPHIVLVQMTSESTLPADDEMHALLNGAYRETLQMLMHNRAALDALIAALLQEPSEEGATSSNGAGSNGASLHENAGSAAVGADAASEEDGSAQQGGTLTGEEVRRIVRELGDEDYLKWVDDERTEFM